MSYGGYQQYGGNPYEGGSGAGQGQYAAQNPYAQDIEAGAGRYGHTAPQQPYGQPVAGQPAGQLLSSDYDPTVQPAPIDPNVILSNQDFLTRVEAVKTEIRNLTTNIGEIGSIHQRILGSPDHASTLQLDNLVVQTQVLNTRIKDQIKALETDAAKSGRNQTKDSQIRTLKSNFKSQLEDYQREEQTYRTRYREQIARQYRIVKPEATDEEVRQAADADWGDEGIFQTALKSNRTGAASSVLGSVRARHNDIQQIERTLIELNQLFQDLAEQVILQEAPVQQVEQQTANVENDTRQGNVQLDKGIVSARRARKLKWWCFFIVLLIIAILALVLGLYFGLHHN